MQAHLNQFRVTSMCRVLGVQRSGFYAWQRQPHSDRHREDQRLLGLIKQAWLEHTELRAPTDGIVKNIKVTTIGGVLRPGDVLMELVPTGDDLVVEAKISPADIAFIKVGQPAHVKLDAYDYSIFGAMDGRISYISPDTLVEDTRNGPLSYYRANININGAGFKGDRSQALEIRPGMTAQVDIRLRDRTVLSYLTKPITKTLNQGMSER